MTRIPLADLDALSDADFVRRLGGLVEHAPWVVEAIARRRPFARAADLLAALRGTITAADPARRMEILRGHPELAGLAARSGSMTAESVSEQQGAGLSALSGNRGRLFDELNAAYRARFGFPFIIAVRRHGVDSILSEFRRRVALSPDEEAATALEEVMRIVALRLDGLVEGPDPLPVSGRISTHVLDAASGIPAAGVCIELVELSEEGDRVLAHAVTNSGGRTDAPLIGRGPVPVATYELRFALGAYHRACGLAVTTPAFLETVPIRFGVADPEGHYHVPLVATPWAYQTYRGS